MEQDNIVRFQRPDEPSEDPLTDVLRHGARTLPAQAIEAEVATFLASHADLVDEGGRRRLVRNGFLPERTIQTGIGAVSVRQPRVRDRGIAVPHAKIRFTSAILPRYLRRTRSLEELMPWLYLKGVSSGDFSEALAALVGPAARACRPRRSRGSSRPGRTNSRSGASDLEGKKYVYVWADGVHFNIRLRGSAVHPGFDGRRDRGRKELIAVPTAIARANSPGRRCWWMCGPRPGGRPELAIGDGAWGSGRRCRRFTAARAALLGSQDGQRARQAAQAIAGRGQGEAARDLDGRDRSRCREGIRSVRATYQAKYAKATCLSKDREVLLTFYDFPAEHWRHLRTTNPIESTFATVRLRTDKTKGAGTRLACLTMVFKLCQSAERRWRRTRRAQPARRSGPWRPLRRRRTTHPGRRLMPCRPQHLTIAQEVVQIVMLWRAPCSACCQVTGA